MNILNFTFTLLIFFLSISIFSHEQKLTDIKNFNDLEYSKFVKDNRILVSQIKQIQIDAQDVFIDPALQLPPHINKETFTKFILLNLKKKMPEVHLIKDKIIKNKNTVHLLVLISGFYEKDKKCFYNLELFLKDSRTNQNVSGYSAHGYCNSENLKNKLKENLSLIIDDIAIKQQKYDKIN